MRCPGKRKPPFPDQLDKPGAWASMGTPRLIVISRVPPRTSNMLALLLLDGEQDAEGGWRPEPSHEPAPLLSGTRILVAEDDAVVRGMIHRVLADEGCEVIAARHGEEALRLVLQAGPPVDLVVTDVRMPRMDGWELGRLLGDRWPELPILYISGWDSELVRGGHRAGRRQAFLRKPFDPSDLVGHIEKLLHGP